MVNKSTVILELDKAKKEHIRWVKKADHLICGLPVENEHIPLESTSCSFGKWLYGIVGMRLRSEYIFERTIERIEVQHNIIHEHYHEIHKIFFQKPPSRTLFHKFIKSHSKKVSKKEREEARASFEKLKEASDELLQLLEKLEKAVKVVDAQVFLQPTSYGRKRA
jgi:hypothetical protein